MGVNKDMTFNCWPKQGAWLGRRVTVYFHNDATKPLSGEIVRDDEAGVTIIALEDGRYVLGTECQYSPF